MKYKLFYPALSLMTVLIFSNACSGGAEKDANVLIVELVPNMTYQTVHNFGASDCWSGQFVGNWPEDQKNRIADLLFSTDKDNAGNPIGIGLSCWRFNIGAGSAQQGEKSNIGDEWRRAPGFLNDDGSYDWEAQASQRWFLRAANERGCGSFIAFVNSPPVQLTKNGKAYSSGGGSGNLPAENYSKYAGYLADVISNIKKLDGIEFDYISPFNEPEWDWKAGENGKAGQEGSPWLNHEIKTICTEIDAALSANQLKTKIEIPETGQLNFLYETGDKPGRSNHIEDFFSPESENYVGNLDHMAGKIAGHSYFTSWGIDKLVDTRLKVREKIAEIDPGLEFWMSEYCLLEDNEQVKGGGKDLGMAPALYMAKVIHADLAIANANAWQWWIAISPYDYKDGLVYIDKNKDGGKIETSKMLWALGNYSRFVTPGSKRIGIARSDSVGGQQPDSLLVSAYRTPEEKYVMVAVNLSKDEKMVKTNIDGEKLSQATGYITSAVENHNLAKMGIYKPKEKYVVPAGSVVTLVFE